MHSSLAPVVADLGDHLAEAGAVVGGGAALFAAVALVAGSVVRDVATFFPAATARGWHEIEPVRWATRAAPYGGVFGATAVIMRAAGVP